MPAESEASRAALAGLDWLSGSLEQLDARGTTPAAGVPPLKALCEVLLACDDAPEPIGSTPIVAELTALGAHVWESGLIRARALRSPTAFRLYFGLLAALTRAGRPLDEQDVWLVSQISARSHGEDADQPAYQQLEASAIAHTLDRDSCHDEWHRGILRSAVRRSLVGARAPVLDLPRLDVYNLTHVAFFATDWGRNDAGLTEADRKYLRMALRLLLPVWTARRDWDLVGELLIVAGLVEAHRAPWVQESLARFLDAQGPDGTFPRHNPDATEFADRYHTVVVCVMLASVWLRLRSRQRVADLGEGFDWGAMLELTARGAARVHELCLTDVVGDQLTAPVLECAGELRRVVNELRNEPQPRPRALPDAERAALEAVAGNRLVDIGRLLPSLATAGEVSPVAIDVARWLLARQDAAGHFGSLAPERVRVLETVEAVDFDREVQWPTTASVTAGLTAFLIEAARVTEGRGVA